MKRTIRLALWFLLFFFSLASPVIAQVDYTEEDYASLTVSPASQIPQATQVMFHLYDNLLANEIEEYGTPLHRENLLSSFVGGSVIVHLEDALYHEPLLMHSSKLLNVAGYSLGYDTGTPKDQQLRSRGWLGRS